MLIYCCYCLTYIDARLTTGDEIYPHKPNLKDMPFWVCTTCHNFIGCHHKTKTPTKPLGTIPTVEIRQLRLQAHEGINRLQRIRRTSTHKIYRMLSLCVGREFHCGHLSTIEEAEKALYLIQQLEDLL